MRGGHRILPRYSAAVLESRSQSLILRTKRIFSKLDRSPIWEIRTTMSALGHVWTAPWQELSDVAAALVGCGHVSGLFVRRIWPLALMLCADRVPIESTHFKVR